MPEPAARSSPAHSGASAPGRSRRCSTWAREPVGFDLGSDDARLRLVLSEEEARSGHSRIRRCDRRVRGRWRARRARDHERRPPRRAAGAVLSRRSRARRPRQRARHGGRPRGHQGAAQPDPRPRLCELDGRVQRCRSIACPGIGRHRADDALRRLQAGERGHGARVLVRRRRRVDRNPPVRRVRPGPGPGAHLGPSLAMEAAAGARATRSRTAAPRSTTSLRTWDARSRWPPGLRQMEHTSPTSGVPSTMQEVVDAIESAAPAVAGKVVWEEGQLPFPESLEARLLERLIGPLTADTTPRRRASHDRALPRRLSASSESTRAAITGSRLRCRLGRAGRRHRPRRLRGSEPIQCSRCLF